jgi:hypothetical protein
MFTAWYDTVSSVPNSCALSQNDRIASGRYDLWLKRDVIARPQKSVVNAAVQCTLPSTTGW